MKAMFRLVAIVALIATIGGEVLEYSETVFKDLELTDENSAEVLAEVINRDVKIEFKEEDSEDDYVLDAVYLVPATKPEFESSKDCGGALGIKLPDTENIYCNIFFFGIEMNYFEDDKETLQLGLLFQYESQPTDVKSLVLDVPIFIQPSEYAEANKQKELEIWAANNKVGIHSPVDSQALDDIRNNKATELTFNWLSDLLSFNITRSKNPLYFEKSEVLVDSYITRPIALPKDVVEKFASLVDEWKQEYTLGDPYVLL